MPIKIADSLPAKAILEQENIFIMPEGMALKQDIRPLKIAILNLMPTKVETETQLLRLISNTPLQIDIDLLQTATYTSRHTAEEHLIKYYQTFDDVREQKYDGLIITGAPVEKMAFEDVAYWPELCEIMEWSKTNVHCTLHICWGAQAGLYYHFGVEKFLLEHKLSGVFAHYPTNPAHPLTRGFDEVFWVPQSRYTSIRYDLIENIPELEVLAYSLDTGPHIIATKSGRQIFVTGHSEYDRDTLAREYFRDVEKGLNPAVPQNYFIDDDPRKPPRMTWRSHANLFFSNWLNYFVYQATPYDLRDIGPGV